MSQGAYGHKKPVVIGPSLDSLSTVPMLEESRENWEEESMNKGPNPSNAQCYWHNLLETRLIFIILPLSPHTYYNIQNSNTCAKGKTYVVVDLLINYIH